MCTDVQGHLCIILNRNALRPAKIEVGVDFPYHSRARMGRRTGTRHQRGLLRMNAQPTPALSPTDLDAFWMPFTANRQFKANPRLLVRAEGMFYWTADGREVIDAVAGLWCVNAGHSRREIADAVALQLNTMEFAPTFQMGHPLAFELASRLA